MEAISHLKLEALNKEKDAFDHKELDARKVQLKEIENQFLEVNTAKLFDNVMMGKSTMSLDFVQTKLDEYSNKKQDLLSKKKSLKDELDRTQVESDDLEGLKLQLDTWVDTFKKSVSLDEKKAMLGQVLKERWP